MIPQDVIKPITMVSLMSTEQISRIDMPTLMSTLHTRQDVQELTK